MPSKPCLWLSGPPDPKPVTVVRMISGLVWRRLSRSSASDCKTRGGRLATMTSAVATSLRTISRPFGAAGERFGGRPGADRDHPTILPAADPLDADHLGAEIAEQRGAERSRDIAPEIEDANAVEHTSHQMPP